MSDVFVPRILVIDDKQEVLEMVSIYLKAQGFSVICKSSPYGIDEVAREFEPAVLVLDISMPAVTGDKLAKLFSSLSPNLPIIFYSSIQPERGRQLAAQFPGALFVPKIDGVAALHSAIMKILREKSDDTSAEDSPETTTR